MTTIFEDDKNYGSNSKIKESSSSMTESKLFDIENEETFDSDMVFDTRKGNRLFNQIQIVEYCSFFFSIVGIMIAMWLYEMRELGYNHKFTYKAGLYYSFICTVGLMISIYARYDL